MTKKEIIKQELQSIVEVLDGSYQMGIDKPSFIKREIKVVDLDKLAEFLVKYIDIKAEDLIRKSLAEKEALVKELQGAIDKINTLSGLIPICAWCKKIRNDQGYWQTVEQYVSEHSRAEFSHSMCPDCEKKYFPEKE